MSTAVISSVNVIAVTIVDHWETNWATPQKDIVNTHTVVVVRLYVIWYTHHATGADDSQVFAKVVALTSAVWVRLLLTLLRQVQDRLGGVQENNLSLVVVINSDQITVQLLSDLTSIGDVGDVLI